MNLAKVLIKAYDPDGMLILPEAACHSFDVLASYVEENGKYIGDTLFCFIVNELYDLGLRDRIGLEEVSAAIEALRTGMSDLERVIDALDEAGMELDPEHDWMKK